ncbi:MAG TPA: hypothetical protein VMV18_02580 [bacterium]|nr:hypothetical protein [bacterium]
MPRLELTAEEIADYLGASLEISGSAFEERTSGVARAVRWFRHLQAFGYEAIPFFAVHDVGHLLLQGDAFPFRAVTDLDRWTEQERPLRLAYENRFLNALRADVRVRRLILLLAQQREDDARMDQLVQRSLEILFAPAREERLEENPAVNPAMLRDTSDLGSLDATLTRTRFEKKHPGLLRALLGAFVARQAARIEIPRLLREEDFFELAHWDALDRPHRRLFARKVQELVSAAGPIDVLRTGVRVESQEAATLVQDEGTYPTGGIGEITTHGSIENLVRSELVYRDDAADVDLFALRWAEGDLLFYTRDSGALHRKRRTLVFALAPHGLRVKDPRHATTRAVLAYSLIARCYEDLFELFGGEGARADLRIVAAKPGDADHEEAALFGMRLKEPMRRGDAAVAVQPALDPATLVDPRRRTFVVAVGDVLLDEITVARMGGTVLRVLLEPAPEEPRDPDSTVFFLDPANRDPAEGIAVVRDELLARVVGVR